MKAVRRVIGPIGLYLFVIAAAVGVAIIGLKVNGIAPFGPHTILRQDLNQQYASYFTYLKRNFGDWQQFLYSSNMTLGGNMFGLTTYYLLSPFNVLLFLFPYSQIPIAVAWMAVAKNAAAAATMLVLVRYFNRHYALKVVVPLQVLLGLSWAFSGWMLHYSMDLMWQDTVILLPLVVLGVERYILHTKWAFYSVMLGLSLILNYYIGYMVALFLVHYFVLRMVIQWRIAGWRLKHILLKLTYFGAISLVTVGLAWVIIWPTLKTLQGVKGTTAYHFTLTHTWTLYRMLNNLFNLTYTPMSWNNPGPAIYTGVIVMIMLAAFFFANRIPGVIRVATGVTLVLLTLESLFDGTNTAWHGFTKPVGFLQRWSFVFGFLFILMALFTFGLMRVSARAARYLFLVVVLVAIMVAFHQVRIFSYQGDYAVNQFTNVTFAYNVAMIAVGALVLTLYFAQPKWQRVTSLLVAVVGVADLAAATVWSYGHQPVYFNMARYSREVQGTNAAVTWIKQHDQSDFYRMELNYQRDRTTPMEFGFNGLTHFSSSQPHAINFMMQTMGYLSSSPWTSYDGGSTRAADSLFGIKYIVDGPAGVTNQASRLVTQGLKPLANVNGYHIYQNPLAQKIGMVAPTKATQVKSTYKYIGVANVGMVYGDLSGVDNIYMLRGGVKETKRDLKARTVNISVPGGGVNRPLYLELRHDKLYTLTPETRPDVVVLVNGKKIVTDGTETESGVIPLGTYPQGQTITVTLKVLDYTKTQKKFDKKKRITHLPKYRVLVGYQERFDQALKQMSQQRVNLKRLKTTHWRGTAIATKADQSLIMTLPYDTDWQVTVDGKPVKAHKYLELMKINLKTAGKHRVELKYTFPELRQGLKVSLAASFGLVILLIIQAITVWGWRIRNRHLERVAKAKAPLFDAHFFDYR